MSHTFHHLSNVIVGVTFFCVSHIIWPLSYTRSRPLSTLGIVNSSLYVCGKLCISVIFVVLWVLVRSAHELRRRHWVGWLRMLRTFGPVLALCRWEKSRNFNSTRANWEPSLHKRAFTEMKYKRIFEFLFQVRETIRYKLSVEKKEKL